MVRFRWAYCQLDTLSRCLPQSVFEALNELPITLDETYERTLQGIAKEKEQHAHRLFQCLVAAIRPLRIEELADILAIAFPPNAEPILVEGWRPASPEEAVLSMCSTLIAIVEDQGSKTVQFSHFSVKEFLTSDRLRTSEIGNVRQYHVPLDTAHATLAQACFTILLPSEEKKEKRHVKTLPLASYSAKHWVDHAKFENVARQLNLKDAMERLFDPRKPHFEAWTLIYNIDDGRRPRKATPLYYAALCGFPELAKHLIVAHAEDVNAKGGHHGTPLHAASYRGHLDSVRLLLDHGADVNPTIEGKRTPLSSAYDGCHLEVMRLLLERGADADMICSLTSSSTRLVHRASLHGDVEALQLLLRHNADVNARGKANCTPLHCASLRGHGDAVELLLDHGAAVDLQTADLDTPLCLASERGHLPVVQALLRHGANVHHRNKRNRTPFDNATRKGHVKVAQLLLEHGTER